jgi:hypothetical protein
VSGPFSDEREARAAAHAAVAPEAGWSILRGPQNRLLLERACKATGVELGAYDRRILDWLAGYEDSICAVVAGLVARAHAAGAASAQSRSSAAQLEEIRLVLACFDWETSDRQFALEQIADIVDGGGAR